MICPDCLEEYQLLDFEVDPETLEHRGLFTCACGKKVLFPETATREMITEDDLKDRLRISRLFHLSRVRTIVNPPPSPPISSFLPLDIHHLRRYLEHFSEHSRRLFK